MTSRGFDISHWQSVMDMGAAAGAGNVFGFIKVTEGDSFRDPNYPAVRKALHDFGLVPGAYHFARPGDGRAQADFYGNVATLGNGEIPILDMEDQAITDPVGYSVAFAKRVIERCATPPLVYLNTWFVNSFNWKPVADLNCGLWFAKYDGNPDPAAGASTGAFGFVAVKQYTDKGTVPGIIGRTGPTGGVDLDSFAGSVDQLRKYSIGAGSVPVPPPPPPPPVVVKHPVVYAWNLPPGQCYGAYSDPSASVHGGYNAWERPFVEDIQCWLIYHGCTSVSPAQWETSTWSDGKWGPETTAAMINWHNRFYPHQIRPDQCWDDDYRRLTTP